MVYVKSGSMLVTIFDQMNFIEEFILKEGDMAIRHMEVMDTKFWRIIQKL